MMFQRKAQEEMIGFGLIIVLVSIILLVFLGFSLNNSSGSSVESYEVSTFLQTFLQHTTACEGSRGFHTLQDLIFECDLGEDCVESGEVKDSCEVLEDSAKKLLLASWPTSEDSPYGGYKFIVEKEGVAEESSTFILEISEGNLTGSSKGSSQPLSRRGNDFFVYFDVYS